MNKEFVFSNYKGDNIGCDEELKKVTKKMKKEISRIEHIIEHRKLYNVRNLLISILIKGGILVDYLLPYILAGCLVYSFQSSKGNAPFKIDKVEDRVVTTTIHTSNGDKVTTISYDIDYQDEILEHTTGWVLNDDGLYERTVTSYRLNNQIDLDDFDSILSMSKEEIEENLFITNIRLIQKENLDYEDFIYNNEAIVLINNYDSKDEYYTRDESVKEYRLNCLLFICLTACWGFSLKGILEVGNMFVKIRFNDILEKCEEIYCEITDDDILKLERLLELKKENLSLIDDNYEDDGNFKIKKLIK